MSAESYAGKRQRVGGDARTAAVVDPAKTSALSSADLESMLKQALGRIDSLERQHEEIKTSMNCETKALRADISALKEENKALQASREDIDALKSENEALQWSLDQLASKVRKGWRYPVAVQPDEYWENKGYDDNTITDIVVGFLENLEKAVSELEHGVCSSVYIGHANRHDDDLMPHWNALFRSFQHINPYGKGVKLFIDSIELNEEIMHQICDNINCRNISGVRFSDVSFTNLRGAISELGNALESPSLKYLAWNENPIESTEDMTRFARALSQSDTIDELVFNENGNANAQALLSGVDLSTYKVLNLSGNSLQTNGRTDISDLIAANTPLEELYLDRNRLNDDDAVLIAHALGSNTHLTELNVWNNNIQERGMRALYEAVNDISSLNALSDSNHSCFLGGLSDVFKLDEINWDDGADRLYTNRMIKIHKLMSDRYRYEDDGNVPHLNMELSGEDSVRLAPFLLESVVRRHDAFQEKIESVECSLGLLYELVRDWKMAELFSFLDSN